MSETITKTLVEELREKREKLLDQLAPAIEQREKEREEFAEVERNLSAEATKAIEAITRDVTKSEDEKRAAVVEADKPLVEARSAFKSAEDAFEAVHSRRERELKAFEQRISEQEVLEFRKDTAAKASVDSASPRVSIRNEEKTYRQKEGSDKGVSYFRDLAAVSPAILASGQMGGNSAEAEGRLRKHAEEMDVELPKRAEERARKADAQIDQAEREFRGSVAGLRRGGLEDNPFEKRVNPNRTDGQGGSRTRKAPIAA